MELSKKIVLARKKQGLTQDELAVRANVTVRTIQRIESGESIPRAFTIKALAKALETDFEELVNGSKNSDSSNTLDSPVETDNLDSDKHFLQTLCLSCFSYLIIPFIHFLIPVYLLKRSGQSDPKILAFGRAIIRQQIYWVIALHFLMLLTLAYNLLMAGYFKKAHLVSYLLPFFGMYLLNALIIHAAFRRINNAD